MKLHNILILAFAVAVPYTHGFSRNAAQKLFTKSTQTNFAPDAINRARDYLSRLPWGSCQNLQPEQWESSRQYDLFTDKMIGTTEHKLHADKVLNNQRDLFDDFYKHDDDNIFFAPKHRLYRQLLDMAHSNTTAAAWFIKTNSLSYSPYKGEMIEQSSLHKDANRPNTDEEIINPRSIDVCHRMIKKQKRKSNLEDSLLPITFGVMCGQIGYILHELL